MLKVSYKNDENQLQICVEDNGEALTDETLSTLSKKLSHAAHRHDGEEITGLINVHERLRIQFGNAYGLSVSRSPIGGLRVTFNLPFKGEDR